LRRLRGVVLFLIVWWLILKVWAWLDGLFGEHGGTTTFLVLLGAAVAWVTLSRRLRDSRPWLWWPVFGAPLACWRLVRTWQPLCEELGLGVPAKRFSRFAAVQGRTGGPVMVRGEPMRLIVPARVGLTFTRNSMLVTVRLHPGQTPGDYERVCEAFAHAWRVHRVRVGSPRPGYVVLTGLGFDPLRHPRAVRVQEARGGVIPSQGGRGTPIVVPTPEVLLVQAGTREDGSPWVIDLHSRPHYLVTGATQSGKSTLTVRLVCELAPRPVALVGIDCKGGMELGPLGGRLSALAKSRREAAGLIEGLVEEMTRRMALCQEHEARSVWELPAGVRPVPLVVIVDEVAELFLSADRAGREEAIRASTGLIRIGQLGAALGVHLWVAGQRFGAELGSGATMLRAQLAGRICHRVADTETAAMTLAGLPPEAIDEAQRIGADVPGVAVAGDDSGSWFLARAQRLPSDEAADIVKRTASRVVPLPDLVARIEIERNAEASGGGW
jgi:DNA segregation ATPase FtsK/SpoIIIE, S-DNA-T family